MEPEDLYYIASALQLRNAIVSIELKVKWNIAVFFFIYIEEYFRCIEIKRKERERGEKEINRNLSRNFLLGFPNLKKSGEL